MIKTTFLALMKQDHNKMFSFFFFFFSTELIYHDGENNVYGCTNPEILEEN